MKKIIALLPVFAIALGCTTQGPRVPSDMAKLTLNAAENNSLSFAKPDLNIAEYRSVFVHPVSVEISEQSRQAGTSDEEAKQIAGYTQKRLKEELAKNFKLVDRPGKNVLSLKIRIVDLDPTSKAQVAMLFPPFSLVNMLSPKGTFIGSITLGGEIFLGNETEASAAFLVTKSRPGVDATSAFGRWSAAEKVVDNFSEKISADLYELQAAQSNGK